MRIEGVWKGKLLKALGWVLIIIAVGPLGLSFSLIANPSLGGFTFIGVFVFVFAIGVWLVRKGGKQCLDS